jgi:TatD DNase family protein
LNFDAFDGEREQILDRARQSGVQRVMNPAIDLKTSLEAIQLAEKYPEIYAAVGIHPNDALTWTPTSLAQLEELASHPKVMAIGEIGLDTYWDRSPIELQVSILKEQLSLAARLELPVIIHLRNRQPGDHSATQALSEILAHWWADLSRDGSRLVNLPGVLHSFSETPEIAEIFTKMNFFIGITGPVTFKNAQALQNVVGLIPFEYILVETDSPFLTPHPLRGKRNEPANVRYVVEKVAEIKRKPVEFVSSATTSNAGRLFSW